jgi:hypothetical protein
VEIWRAVREGELEGVVALCAGELDAVCLRELPAMDVVDIPDAD